MRLVFSSATAALGTRRRLALGPFRPGDLVEGVTLFGSVITVPALGLDADDVQLRIAAGGRRPGTDAEFDSWEPLIEFQGGTTPIVALTGRQIVDGLYLPIRFVFSEVNRVLVFDFEPQNDGTYRFGVAPRLLEVVAG